MKDSNDKSTIDFVKNDSRGGSRPGSGRKAKWYGVTEAMRVPETWKPLIQGCMDNGVTPIFENVQDESQNVSKLQAEIERLQSVYQTVSEGKEFQSTLADNALKDNESLKRDNERLRETIQLGTEQLAELEVENERLRQLLEAANSKIEDLESLPDFDTVAPDEMALEEPEPIEVLDPKTRDELLQAAHDRREAGDKLSDICSDFNQMGWTPAAYPGRTQKNAADSWNVKSLSQVLKRKFG